MGDLKAAVLNQGPGYKAVFVCQQSPCRRCYYAGGQLASPPVLEIGLDWCPVIRNYKHIKKRVLFWPSSWGVCFGKFHGPPPQKKSGSFFCLQKRHVPLSGSIKSWQGILKHQGYLSLPNSQVSSTHSLFCVSSQESQSCSHRKLASYLYVLCFFFLNLRCTTRSGTLDLGPFRKCEGGGGHWSKHTHRYS